MNTLSYLRYFIFIIGLIAIDVQAEIELQGIAETAYYECEDLGISALAIQSIRYEQNSSIQEIMDRLDGLIRQELGPQPLFMHRIKAVATWVFYNYPADFSPGLVGQTYTVECKIKTSNQIRLLVDNDNESEERRAWESAQQSAD